MTPPRLLRHRGCYLSLLALVPGLALAGSGPDGANGGAVADEEVQIKGVFDTELPRTERKHYLRLIVHPHFGDLHRKDHLRAPVGVRYGLTENWEVSAAVEGYFSHGLGGIDPFAEAGLSELQFGTKYRPDWTLLAGWEMALGLDYSHPLDHPPVELTDGLEHMKPYVTFARDFPDWHGVRWFWGTGVDYVSTTSVAGRLEKNEFGQSANTFTTGFVLPREGHAYTFETTWATNALMGDGDRNLNRITARPGFVLELPDSWTFGSKGNWVMGVATPVTWGPDGWEFGLSVKFRGNFDLKKMLRR
ncbi:hypothetical protein [Actomonas aquatica]|uniref:Transporter n=1 Tax=Actomonas aquatica TaxID=2866162 RepID=A0ABZ1C544_9BACT|nr:hypothetical protein [Opitutus sp. WL0086]WRQ86467.1 hypothetical protein K1X11_016750 [Opitutus sp. WL0086]